MSPENAEILNSGKTTSKTCGLGFCKINNPNKTSLTVGYRTTHGHHFLKTFFVSIEA